MAITTAAGTRLTRTAAGLPPVSYFAVSAIFHYLGPSLAVLLFARISAPGVLWLRIVAAAAVFAVWRRPWRLAGQLDRLAKGGHPLRPPRGASWSRWWRWAAFSPG